MSNQMEIDRTTLDAVANAIVRYFDKCHPDLGPQPLECAKIAINAYKAAQQPNDRTKDMVEVYNEQPSGNFYIGPAAWKRAIGSEDDHEAFDKWCESVKDCGHTVQPYSATARQRKLGWDAAMAMKRESSALPVGDVWMALRRLVLLKEHKDKHGKDAYYQEEQPHAWTQARTALSKMDEQGRRG